MQEPHIYPGRIQTSAGDHLNEEEQAAADKARQVKEDAKTKAKDAYQQIKGEGKKLAKESGNHLKKMVSEQKSCLAEKLTHFRDAAKAAGEKLSSEDDQAAAKTVNQAASQLDQLTTYITESDPQDLLDDLGELTRKRPEVVFGSMFLVGLGLARFMKASRHERESEQSGASRFATDSEITGRSATGRSTGTPGTTKTTFGAGPDSPQTSTPKSYE